MNNGRINVAGPKPARRAPRRLAGSLAADSQEQPRNLQTVRERLSAPRVREREFMAAIGAHDPSDSNRSERQDCCDCRGT